MQAARLRQENSMCILIFASNVACVSYFLLEASENAMFHEPHSERNRLNRNIEHTTEFEHLGGNLEQMDSPFDTWLLSLPLSA